MEAGTSAVRLSEEAYQELLNRRAREAVDGVTLAAPGPMMVSPGSSYVQKEERKPQPFKLKMLQASEDDEQAALAKYLRLLEKKYGFKWTHPPNGGDRDIRVAARLKSHGVSKGVSDVLIFGAPPKFPGCPGAAIELKRKDGGTVSGEQQEWLDYLESIGWKVKVALGWEGARTFLSEIGWVL